MKKKKVFTVVLSVVLAVLIVIGGAVGLLMRPMKPVYKERNFETADGVLRVGVISDLQTPGEGGTDNYKKALELFKEKGVNVIINAGDITDVGRKSHYENHKAAFDSVYSEEDRANVELSYVLGNHDYWLPMFFDCFEIPFTYKMHSRFTKYTYAESPWTHKVINGYHFISLSPANGSMSGDAYNERVLKWAEEEIKKAVEDNPELPIFVTTHNNPEGTVYYSDDACPNLDELYKKYPQVVSLSGHSHAPLMDEEAIYQKDYTAISTQCTSYVCFTETANSVVQNNSDFIEDNPMVMIMELDGERTTIQRYSVLDGKAQKEPWIIENPVSKDTFKYTEARKDNSKAPVWGEEFKITATPADKACRLTFTKASHEDMVESYRMVFKKDDSPVEIKIGEDTYKDIILITDFSLPEYERDSEANFSLSEEKFGASLPAGKYEVEIYASDTFGNESEAMTAEIEIKY